MVDLSQFGRSDSREEKSSNKNLFTTVCCTIAALAIAGIILLPGQVNEVVEGDTITFTYTMLRPLLIVALGGSMAVLGIVALIEEIRLGHNIATALAALLTFVGILGVAIFAPASTKNYLKITGSVVEMDDRGA